MCSAGVTRGALGLGEPTSRFCLATNSLCVLGQAISPPLSLCLSNQGTELDNLRAPFLGSQFSASETRGVRVRSTVGWMEIRYKEPFAGTARERSCRLLSYSPRTRLCEVCLCLRTGQGLLGTLSMIFISRGLLLALASCYPITDSVMPEASSQVWR